jgi:2-iminobutanoate/2-iminopropanoate deaminase
MSNEKRIISSPDAPAAIGPYSQAVKANGFVYTAGQIPLDPATGEVVEGDIAAQTERVMQSLKAVLAAAGSDFDRVIKTTCFRTDLGNFAAFNEIYAAYFGSGAPARSTVEVSKLPRGVLVEVECVALAAD